MKEHQQIEWKVAFAQAGLPEPRYSGTGSTLRLTFPFGSKSDTKSDRQAIASDRQAIDKR